MRRQINKNHEGNFCAVSDLLGLKAGLTQGKADRGVWTEQCEAKSMGLIIPGPGAWIS